MAKPFTALRDPRLGLDDTLPFGRHRGYTVEEILKDRPEYISWLMSNTSLKFYPSVHELLLLMKPKRVPQHTSFRTKYFGDEAFNTLEDAGSWFEDVPF